ncbi:hypothetical protein QR680_012588 [Steinernema hermaphroditum]|uniref:Suppressor of Ty 6 homolog n=1 Tax=Steinernema hermaphroditum TaxID=289476 RepID=A0AA39I4S8_9BILA|nr:hypothetical protein QR680_012588 [Steinernema hermaphroditum]
MSEFLDNQAEESENEDSGSETFEPKAKKAKRSKKSKKSKKSRISDDEEEDEEDDDARLKEEMQGFVVEGDDDEEGGDDDDDDKSEKSGGSLGELSEEDLDLINDNIGLERTGGRVVIDDDDDDLDDRDRIGKNLFSNDDFVDREPDHRRDRQPNRRREYDEYDEPGSESERSEDNFIVHDEGRRPNRIHHGKKRHDIAEGALDEARDVFGVEDFDFNEFYDEEADVADEEEEYQDDEIGEDGEPLSRARRPRKEKKNLLEVIEPSELERGFLSNEAKRIQLDDKPERFLLRRIPVVPVPEGDDSEIGPEAIWIYDNAFHVFCISRQDPSDVVNRQIGRDDTIRKIKDTLEFIRSKSFEVPFIAFYRKEHVEPVLEIGDLWRIFIYDEKWCLLQQSKEKLLKLMHRMQIYHDEFPVGPEKGRSKRPITENDFLRVEGVGSFDELNDVRLHFELYYGPEIKHMTNWEIRKDYENNPEKEDEEVKYKLSGRQDKYTLCVQCGLEDLSLRFGLTPEQFAENLDWKKHEVSQEPKDPLSLASEYCSENFSNPEDVLKGALYMLAKQLSREPVVRSKWRDIFRQRAMINCRPTKKGRDEIDINHPLYSKRYLREKPVGDLEKTDYLVMWQGKKNGLIDFSIIADKSDDAIRKTTMVDVVLEDQIFYRDEFSDSVEQWNQLRRDAVAMCINEFLIPKYVTEMHEKLLQEAKDVALKQLQASLWNKLKTAAFKPDPENAMLEDDDDEIADPNSVRIMSIVQSLERDQASFGVLIDQDGQVIETIRLTNLTTRRHPNRPVETGRKNQDIDKFKQFVARKKPHIIGIAAENLDTMWIKQDLETAIRELVEESELRRMINVDYVDNEVCKIYMNSKMAQSEFPDYPLTLRQAVSLARVILDPLVEYSHLCNADEDILCLSLHPLQSEFSKEELKFTIDLEFINRVNEVGVDVNRCLELPHQANLVQFICGLGPRKADHLLKMIRQQEVLESRTKLVVGCKMGPNVFMNCAGFIKIDVHHVADRTDSYVEVLDGSRVHPETYEWARKMAIDALEIEDGVDPSSAIEEILQNPERLRDLDLDAFADELARQNFGNRSITLYDIRAELTCRYKDLRLPYEPPDRTTVFYLLAKEAPETFCEGKLVCAKVQNVVHRKPKNEQPAGDLAVRHGEVFRCSVCYRTGFYDMPDVFAHIDSGSCPGTPVGVRVRFDNGLSGFIPNKLLSDKNDQFMDPSTRVREGQPIWGKITKIDFDRIQCDLSCRTSDLAEVKSNVDMYFDRQACDEDEEAERRSKQRKTTHSNFVKRVISHQAFHNVSFKDAERILQDLNQGEAIIRPSSKSAHHLTITWKVANGIYQHIDVEEQDKDQLFSLGKKLLIAGENFEDLDEILARYVQPMANYAQEIISHKYAVDLKAEQREAIERRLSEEKRQTPKRIPYVFCPSVELPGKFVISYLPRVRPKHEYMTVTPEGIRFRGRTFQTLDNLLGWFKNNFAVPPPVMGHPPPYHRRPEA